MNENVLYLFAIIMFLIIFGCILFDANRQVTKLDNKKNDKNRHL